MHFQKQNCWFSISGQPSCRLFHTNTQTALCITHVLRMLLKPSRFHGSNVWGVYIAGGVAKQLTWCTWRRPVTMEKMRNSVENLRNKLHPENVGRTSRKKHSVAYLTYLKWDKDIGFWQFFLEMLVMTDISWRSSWIGKTPLWSRRSQVGEVFSNGSHGLRVEGWVGVCLSGWKGSKINGTSTILDSIYQGR